jgi:phosphonoacetaldehyde dehydrogenase
MVAHKVAPAIATNNCIVVKPTELTPMTALVLADILYEAGLPPEMLSVVTGWPADIGEEMIVNEHVDLITFTGGVATGKLIASKAGYRRQVLELGGNDPLIVLDDLSDDDLAAQPISRWPARRRIPASAARPSSASWSRTRWPTVSCRWCWNGRRSCVSATRWIARRNSARWSDEKAAALFEARVSRAAEAGARSSTIPDARARCCRPSWSTGCRMMPNW